MEEKKADVLLEIAVPVNMLDLKNIWMQIFAFLDI